MKISSLFALISVMVCLSNSLLTTKKDIGVNMRRNFMIRYEFDENQGLPTTDVTDVRVIFRTLFKQGILMQIQSPAGEYVSLEMNNNGGVRFALTIGGRYGLNTLNNGMDYANNQKHEVHFWRTGVHGEIVYLQIDNDTISTDYLPMGARDQMIENPKYLFIGNNNTDIWQGFEGCIYSMKIDNIYPLDIAFQDPRPSYVTFYPSTIRKDECGYQEMPGVPAK